MGTLCADGAKLYAKLGENFLGSCAAVAAQSDLLRPGAASTCFSIDFTGAAGGPANFNRHTGLRRALVTLITGVEWLPSV